MLRVVIEVEQSTGGKRKLSLRPGEQVEFGRSEYANVVLRGDEALSAKHFRLRADREACYLEDLGSSNGTYVNGDPVESVVLRDGDGITAGQTKLRVSIEGGAPPDSIAPPPAAARPRPDRLRKSVGFHATYAAEKCNSGLTVCRGTSQELAPAALAAQVSRAYPLYLIVDLHRLGQPPESAPDNSEYLIDWLGEEVAAGTSPHFFAAAEVQQWAQHLEEAWGADAVVCVFSSRERADLLAHLRQAIRGRGDRESRGIVGYCWPNVLQPFLRSSEPETVASLMAGIEAVLVESPDDPEPWQLFGSEELPEILNQLGFEQQTNGPAEESEIQATTRQA